MRPKRKPIFDGQVATRAISIARHFCVSIAVLGAASVAHAETLEVRFDSHGSIESGDAFTNLVDGVVQSPFIVANWDDGNGPQSTPFSVGDGRHGIFDSATYFNYDSDLSTPLVVEVDTDRFPDLQFTEFRLRSGYTIRPVGSKPLTLRSQSTFRIDATAVIDCSGGDGAPNGAVGISPAGGSGRCGGVSGGRGGSSLGAATAGTSVAGFAATAGGAGLSPGHGGGGGAGLADTVNNAIAGKAVSGSGGGAGVRPVTPDRGFTSFAGGASGGGGAMSSGSIVSGSGGGAGGGTILIYSAGVFTYDGNLIANGGWGGSAVSDGGPGGAGAGGSIRVFTGATLTGAGAMIAIGGSGGATSFTPSNPDGGRGSDGRVWSVGASGGAGSNTQEYVNLIAEGQTTANPNSVAISRLIDLEATRAQFSSITSDNDGSTTLEVATATAPFSVAEANWKPASLLLELSGKRYARFRLTLTAVTKVRSVKFVYTAIPRENFDFGSCQMVGSGPGSVSGSGGQRGLFLFVLLIPILFAQKLRRKEN